MWPLEQGPVAILLAECLRCHVFGERTGHLPALTMSSVASALLFPKVELQVVLNGVDHDVTVGEHPRGALRGEVLDCDVCGLTALVWRVRSLASATRRCSRPEHLNGTDCLHRLPWIEFFAGLAVSASVHLSATSSAVER